MNSQTKEGQLKAASQKKPYKQSRDNVFFLNKKKKMNTKASKHAGTASTKLSNQCRQKKNKLHRQKQPVKSYS